MDANDNELAYLEAIHLFVEVLGALISSMVSVQALIRQPPIPPLSLDSFFGNVCELDLLFNFHKVYAVLDEVFLAGEIQETSKSVVLGRLEHLESLQ